MKKERESDIFIILLFLLLPYLATVIILGRRACPVNRDAELEEFVAAAAASQISWDYSEEAVKAQTVIARTNLYFKQAEGKEEQIIEKAVQDLKAKNMNGQLLRKYAVFQEAAYETRGQILKLNDEIREVPYHALSQGKTRDGKEVLGDDFSFLPSVETPKDIDSPLYVEGCYFSLNEIERKIKEKYTGFSIGNEGIAEIKSWDSMGFVMEIQIGNQEFQGEEIREILELPSSCFTVQKLNHEVRFLCRGIGHGLGMSQYTAQQMALEGKGYEDILKYFFPRQQLGKY